ncbi:hypothetical protein EHS25_007093 [Saitozyma podzolica]|uniref:Zn(2)-C6 fungal-type domain-containing protein n=1 Tax=Saitozyma podzolica TaxID=1890683 RepID=A0A427XPJ7_9TREE|nr:hypothetical protein EHS25_007093 [Saitozyma podzolica]
MAAPGKRASFNVDSTSSSSGVLTNGLEAGPSAVRSAQSTSDPRRTTKKARIERACDRCREKRLRCEFDLDQSDCRNCLRHRQTCRALEPPPADDRPRNKRDRRRQPTAYDSTREEGEASGAVHEEDDQWQGLEPRFLGLTALDWSLLSSSDHHGLKSIDDRYSHARIQVESSGDEIVLVTHGKTDNDERAMEPSASRVAASEVKFALNLRCGKLAADGGSFSWLTVGSAIRTALDIGLHRDIAGDEVSQQQIDRRRRVWASCVIADRWYALSFGQPMTINLLDCDAHGPSVYTDGCRDGQGDSEAPFTMHAEMTKVGSRGALLMLVHSDTRFKQLSILLGRVLRAAYRPLGMDLITDSTLRQLQQDIEQWHSNLPTTLRLRTERNSDPKAGLLCLFSVCVDFVFMRAFLRPKKPIPPHITFRPRPDSWDDNVSRSELAIKWVAEHVMYSYMWCFFVQLHAYVATGDARPLDLMQMVDKSMQGWAAWEPAVSNDLALRTKVFSLANTLTAAALGSHHRRHGHISSSDTAVRSGSPPALQPDFAPTDFHLPEPTAPVDLFDEVFQPARASLDSDMQLLELFIQDHQLGWALQPSSDYTAPVTDLQEESDPFYSMG